MVISINDELRSRGPIVVPGTSEGSVAKLDYGIMVQFDNMEGLDRAVRLWHFQVRKITVHCV